MAKGKIGVTTENIFPVIKKFLYSDHEIFLRELVANAIDASTKLRTLASFGEFKGELGTLDVRVTVDKEAGTLTVSDRGIGMDAEDIEKYINQIAFSGAEEFLAKYKDNANNIIGHFGLGFYSAFMVSKRVVIRSLSYKENAKGVQWSCDGSPEFEMEEIDRTERGTDIILYIDDESKEFLEQARIDTLLKKYCRFMPLPVISGKVKEWKDNAFVDTDKDNVINSTEPLWTRKPTDLTDEDYLKFYHELMPGQDDPLFHIHLNVDYPFTLTGILYFPKVKNNIELQRNRIELYCNQMFVTNQVEGVVPEFMTLMQGVLDSPDIPLNVSRSYLQADSEVKKISTYITKKVAEKLAKMFADNREEFEKKWDDIKIFIEYGMLTDKKFYEAATKFFLLKDTEGKYFTIDEYKTLVEGNQTDKEKRIIFIYSADPKAQYSYIKGAQSLGYNVLVMDSQLAPHIIMAIESQNNDIHFVRVDADIPELLVEKENSTAAGLSPLELEILSTLYRSQIPEIEKTDFLVDFRKLAPNNPPAVVTQAEYTRRMKEMAQLQPGMSFIADMPESYNLVINVAHPAVEKIDAEALNNLKGTIEPINNEIDSLNEQIKKAEGENPKPENLPELEKSVADKRNEEETAIRTYAASAPRIRQVIDLALLRSHLLSGENLTEFIDRSAQLLSE